MPTLCNCLRCETAGTFLERRDAAPVATSADVPRPLGGASARNLSNARPSVREDGCAGGSTLLSPDALGAFDHTFHDTGDTHVRQ